MRNKMYFTLISQPANTGLTIKFHTVNVIQSETHLFHKVQSYKLMSPTA